MAAVSAPLEEIERILKTITGYVVIANVNSNRQGVIGGASKPVEQAMEAFQKAGYDVTPLSVSHAFHTTIVASASEPLKRVLQRLHLASPRLPIVANTNGEFYPVGPDVVPKCGDSRGRVAAPVQFVKGLRTLYRGGCTECSSKSGLRKRCRDLPKTCSASAAMWFRFSPMTRKSATFPHSIKRYCCLYAAGLGGEPRNPRLKRNQLRWQQLWCGLKFANLSMQRLPAKVATPVPFTAATVSVAPALDTPVNGDHYIELGKMLADVLERGWQITQPQRPVPVDLPVAITGAALGLPGTDHIFDDGNIGRILRGEQFIDTIPTRLRRGMLDKHITRLVKNDNGGAFETITSVADVIKLAGRGGAFDLEHEFGISADRVAALDRDTQLAIAVGLDALRDAGIPLVLRYKTTTKGTQLPDRWVLPEALRDDTGVIFASAFPGLNSFADEMERYYVDHARREQLTQLQSLRARLSEVNGDSIIGLEMDRRMEDICDLIEKEPYMFDRRFLFRVLPMGHSQFAELIGARGPNTQINSACASTTQAVALAEDWIRAGRCHRVIVVAADDITTDQLIDWMGAGFLASGAAATDDVVEEAAIPFDRRRHGMLMGMGAAGLVVESAEAARERGIQPICEVLSAVTANSAFHGTRLDVQHISQVMEDLVSKAETRSGVRRHQIAPQTVFISHETYTPARGGSAAAEIHALRHVFGESADKIVIANTKGFTGHAMGAGVEDVLAVKALETGIVPPVANFKEADPELGDLNLSKGGVYPVEYAFAWRGLRLADQHDPAALGRNQRRVTQKPECAGHAYRIADTNAWNAWLSGIAGHPVAELEVANRTLRVRDAHVREQAATPLAKPAVALPVAALPATKPEAAPHTAAVDSKQVDRKPTPALWSTAPTPQAQAKTQPVVLAPPTAVPPPVTTANRKAKSKLLHLRTRRTRLRRTLSTP